MPGRHLKPEPFPSQAGVPGSGPCAGGRLAAHPGDNPFSASRVRPGAVRFVFEPGRSVHDLVECLRKNGWWGQIVGAHGSGKSALLAVLLPALRGAGQQPILIQLHDGQRTLPVDLRRVGAMQGETLIAVDGYEQLSRWSRWRLKRFCRKNELGLLVTSHCPLGLPELYRTETSPELARRVVELLLRDRAWQVPADRLAECFQRHAGNLREVLFELYDWFEHDRRKSP